MRIKILVLFAMISSFSIAQTVWFCPIPEIPILNLQDIAVSSFYQGRPCIYYNPVLVAQADPAFVVFARAHEYGHHALGHLLMNTFLANPYQRVMLSIARETEADHYAYLQLRSNPQIIQAVIRDFESQGNSSDGFHPTGFQRAANLRGWLNADFASNSSDHGNEPDDEDGSEDDGDAGNGD